MSIRRPFLKNKKKMNNNLIAKVFTPGAPFTLRWFGRSGIVHRTDTVINFDIKTGIVEGNLFKAHFSHLKALPRPPQKEIFEKEKKQAL